MRMTGLCAEKQTGGSYDVQRQEQITATTSPMPHDASPVNLNLCAASGIFFLSKPD